MKLIQEPQGSQGWLDIFVYEPDSGRLLNRTRRNSRSGAGVESGYINAHGYRVTRVEGRTYRVHRIIWEMHYGPIPEGLEIDHINRVRSDNRLANLRLANRTLQTRNTTQRRSLSNVRGVVFNKKDRRWQAQIGVNGKHVYLGQHKTLGMACEARKAAEIKYGFRSE